MIAPAPAPASHPPREIGPYRLIRILGRGGFAPVWLAREVHDERFLREVAIKLFSLPPTIDAGSAEAAAFRDGVLAEARALCRVEHPNVVRFHGVCRDDSAGLLGLVMELLRGPSLFEKVREKGALAFDEVTAAGADIAWALSAVHQAGLLHRDVKPGNVLAAPGGYRLIDFGIVIDTPGLRPMLDASMVDASMVDASRIDAPRLDSPGAAPAEPSFGELRTELVAPAQPSVPPLVGTHGYVAPECLQGAAPSPASDLFALGATLFRIGAGTLPPPSLSAERVVATLAATAPGDAGLGLGKLVAQLLSPDPAARPRHAEWVARELTRLRRLHARRQRVTIDAVHARAPGMGAVDDRFVVTGAAKGARSSDADSITGPANRGSDSTADAITGPAMGGPDSAADSITSPATDEDAPPPSFSLGRARRADPVAPAPNERPSWVGHAAARRALELARDRARTSGMEAALVTGPFGIGRTRLVEEILREAGKLAADRDRVGAAVTPTRVVVVRPKAEGRRGFWPLFQAIEALPEDVARAMDGVRDAIDRALGAGALAVADADQAVAEVEEALLCAAETEPLTLAIDDAQWADGPLLSLLKGLFSRAKEGHPSRLFVVATVRDEPFAKPALRSFVAAARAARSERVRVEAMGPLLPEEAIALANAVFPLDPKIAEVVGRASGGTPLLVVHALIAWHAASELIWEGGRYRADGERLFREPVPGMGDMLVARLSGLFEGDEGGFALAYRVLACVAFHGGGPKVEALCAVLPPAAETERVIERLADAALVRSGERGAIGLSHEMMRQATLNLVRERPWFWRLARAVLDEAARSIEPGGAVFLAEGYERLGVPSRASEMHLRAADEAERAGLFADAASHVERIAVLAEDPRDRVRARARAARLWFRARALREASLAADAVDAERSVLPEIEGVLLTLRVRALRMEIDAALGESVSIDGETDGGPSGLVIEADATGDAALRCEVRVAVAGLASEGEAIRLLGEAIAIAERCGPALAFAARTQRIERAYAASVVDRAMVEEDLRRVGAIARAAGSDVQRLQIEGDLAILQADRGDLEGAVARLRAVLAETTARRMSALVRVGSQNLAALLHRAGRYAECAEMARRAAEASGASFDPWFQSSALSLCADALRRSGDAAAALPIADVAVQIQEARRMKILGITLLRRAEIKKALGRVDEAREDARRARDTAKTHGEADIELSVHLWEAITLAETTGDLGALGAAISDVQRAREGGTNLRPIATQLLEAAIARRDRGAM